MWPFFLQAIYSKIKKLKVLKSSVCVCVFGKLVGTRDLWSHHRHASLVTVIAPFEIPLAWCFVGLGQLVSKLSSESSCKLQFILKEKIIKK
jgi:hypothetical protein